MRKENNITVAATAVHHEFTCSIQMQDDLWRYIRTRDDGPPTENRTRIEGILSRDSTNIGRIRTVLGQTVVERQSKNRHDQKHLSLHCAQFDRKNQPLLLAHSDAKVMWLIVSLDSPFCAVVVIIIVCECLFCWAF
jgi:hypothetical protein